MSDWTTAADLRAQVASLWEKGALPTALIAADEAAIAFPLRLSLRTPKSADLSARFADVREWAVQLRQGEGAGYRLAMREVRHRVIGQNRLPDAAFVDSMDDALRFIGKQQVAQTLLAMADETGAREPALLPWLRQQPLRGLALAQFWRLLLDIVAWLKAHPRPGIYLRQVDVAGAHSKFIESHRGVLAELFDLALRPEHIDATATGAAMFAQRYGFRDKPLRVRLRFLDPAHAAWAPGADADYSVLQDAFTVLDPKVSRVFITENEINFLAFPLAVDSLVIFGAGYGFEMLSRAAWLHRRCLFYWGDIDTHGFAILDQLRAHFPNAQSLLMDRETLLAHRQQWTDEPTPLLRDLPRLNAEERRLYDDLRWLRLGDKPLRLEQERIAFGRVERAIATIGARRSDPGEHQHRIRPAERE